jgi:hypothetical protein
VASRSIHGPRWRSLHGPRWGSLYRPPWWGIDRPRRGVVYRPGWRNVYRARRRPLDRPGWRPVYRSRRRSLDRPAWRPVDRPRWRPVYRPRWGPLHRPQYEPLSQQSAAALGNARVSRTAWVDPSAPALSTSLATHLRRLPKSIPPPSDPPVTGVDLSRGRHCGRTVTIATKRWRPRLRSARLVPGSSVAGWISHHPVVGKRPPPEAPSVSSASTSSSPGKSCVDVRAAGGLYRRAPGAKRQGARAAGRQPRPQIGGASGPSRAALKSYRKFSQVKESYWCVPVAIDS